MEAYGRGLGHDPGGQFARRLFAVAARHSPDAPGTGWARDLDRLHQRIARQIWHLGLLGKQGGTAWPGQERGPRNRPLWNSGKRDRARLGTHTTHRSNAGGHPPSCRSGNPAGQPARGFRCCRRRAVFVRTGRKPYHRPDSAGGRGPIPGRRRLERVGRRTMATNGMEETGVLETDAVLVRTMRQEDLNVIVAIDAAASGRRRPRYFELMLQRSITQAGLQISLVAEVDNRVVGFVIGSLYYGEYGVAEPSASIDAISVDARVRGRNVGKALMRQLRLNLGALRITTLRTEVSWDHFGLLGFFRSQGFKPSTRICLECALDPTRPDDSAGS